MLSRTRSLNIVMYSTRLIAFNFVVTTIELSRAVGRDRRAARRSSLQNRCDRRRNTLVIYVVFECASSRVY